AVERAFDAIADHLAAVPDMGTEVAAVAGENMQFAGLVAIGHEVFAEIAQRTRLAERELRRPADHEPAGDFPGEGDLHVTPPMAARRLPAIERGTETVDELCGFAGARTVHVHHRRGGAAPFEIVEECPGA